ncbi:helix-turn-helix transcriptional regulator [Mesobacillus maritimus]|uniref:substrate-binding domain-containing protein n=1 Tax=Mesobacillus maritimus TaxID=1643336 RepID=UPI00203D8577|nr:helix-turn-helix transcriptional regulator [Mesobacillus maritimus]MCM3585094.1 helix-turn-helix transcriptional regulator [Mesobacillus maritimus]MCM3670316.1 helix-turn-helix transcriptional regulator [Mesobacillus maritimus]
MKESTYTVEEIAQLFKISKHTVYELIKRGELNAFKVGNKMRIEHSEVEHYKQMKASKIAPAAQQATTIKPAYTLNLAGSHDFLVEHLVKYAAIESAGLALQPSYIGSLEGLMMLYRGNVDIAAIHLLDPTSQQYNLPFIRQLFVHEPITVVRLASREQGLIVAKGNPKNISSVRDFSRSDVTIVNRQKGAGTRFLLDSFLAAENINPQLINGYENEEWSHLGAASFISHGSADAAFGVKYAASQLGLDFIPLTNEKFDLVFHWTSENKEALEHLLDLLHFTTFKDSILKLDGYDASQLGKIIYEHR